MCQGMARGWVWGTLGGGGGGSGGGADGINYSLATPRARDAPRSTPHKGGGGVHGRRCAGRRGPGPGSHTAGRSQRREAHQAVAPRVAGLQVHLHRLSLFATAQLQHQLGGPPGLGRRGLRHGHELKGDEAVGATVDLRNRRRRCSIGPRGAAAAGGGLLQRRGAGRGRGRRGREGRGERRRQRATGAPCSPSAMHAGPSPCGCQPRPKQRPAAGPLSRAPYL
jgi:hypothetical protein